MTYEKIAFVDERNAGKSQLATAVAEFESARRGLDVSVVTGGVTPAERIRPEVRAVLDEVGLDVDGRTPRKIRDEDIADADYVVTMDCMICDFKPPFWRGPADRWELDHADGAGIDHRREQRNELTDRVSTLLDDLEAVMD